MTRTSPRAQSVRRTAVRLSAVGVALALATGAASIPSGVANAATTSSALGTSVHHGGVTLTGPVVLPKAPTKSKATLPASVNLSANHVAVANQGNHESCVGWAIGYALMGWEARHAGLADPSFAAYYVYSQINGGVDQGSDPGRAVGVITAQGVDTIPHYWQQAAGADDPITQPTAAEKANALPWRATGAHVWFSGAAAGANGIALIKSALAAGEPVAVSLPVRPGFDALRAGSAPDSDVTGASRGGHEVLALGYDANGLLIQNSWGTGWGDTGFGRLAWNVVQYDVNSAYSVDGLARTTTTTDTTGPSVSAPASLPQLGSSTATDGTTKYVTSFSAADASGVSSTLVDVQVDGGTWTALTLPAATTTAFTYDLAPGHTYRFTASAYDSKGNWSGWVYGPAFGVQSYSEAYASYSTGWTQSAWASAVGGALRVTATANASASFTFTGRGIAWVASKSTNRSQAWVYLDGVYQGVWDTYAATTQARAVVLTASWTTSGTHTLKLVDVATAGRPNLDVDALVVTS